MDIRELRIGNIVKCKNYGRMFVDSIYAHSDKKVSCCTLRQSEGFIVPIEYIYPIKINEELLLKVGFSIEYNDITKDKYYRLRLNGFCIDINKWSNTVGRDYGMHIDNLSCDSVLSADIQYLHQLQNCVFDATGKELDVRNLLKY